jgi:asparagine synthase (glutamine-hydrolysing)
MCLWFKAEFRNFKTTSFRDVKIIRHRGPDWAVFLVMIKQFTQRLAIVDPASGKQPLFSADGKLVLLLMAKSIIIEIHANSLNSSLQKWLALQERKDPTFRWNEWYFGFAIYDVDKDEYFVARDHMGIIPLYIGWDQHGTFM